MPSDDRTPAAPPSPSPGPATQALPRRLRGVFCLDDFEPLARRHLPRPIFGYVAGATETNATLRDNRAVFESIRFVPRVLADVTARSQAFTLFGRRYEAPFGIAPMGICGLTGYRGDLVLARAAQAAGIPMVLSSSALVALEEVAQAAPGSWFQAYPPGDPARTAALVARVARAGYETLVVTVDSSVVPNRENNLRNRFVTPLRPGPRLAWDGITHPRWTLGTFLRTWLRHGMPHFENNYAERGAPLLARNVMRDFAGRENLDWGLLGAIRRQWQGHLVLKGITHPADARLAREAGADAIVVSNHGGRQLDGTAAPLWLLPQVVEAAGPLPVMVDSGFRRGTDVLKAIALGARCVFVGRPFNYAQAVGGEAGIAHAIALLKAEIRADMGLLGVNTLAELGRDRLLLPPELRGAGDALRPV